MYILHFIICVYIVGTRTKIIIKICSRDDDEMEVDGKVFVDVIRENAKNNERLAIAIDGLRNVVKEIHEKYGNFSVKMTIVEIEMGFIILLTAGILFKLM